MADNTIPPLPPGFQLEDDAPPLPPGFVVENAPNEGIQRQSVPEVDAAAIARQTYDESPWYQRPFIAAGAEMNRLGRGVQQILSDDDSAFGRNLQARIDADAPYQQGVHGVSGFIGRALPYIATLPLGAPEAAALGRIPQAGKLAQLGVKAGTAAAEGAAYGALGETRTGESRLENAGFGALGGLAGRSLVGGLRASARGMAREADPILQADVATARANEIPLHVSQVAQSTPAKLAASAAKYLPLSGSGSAARKQQNAWNKALTRLAGDETERLDDTWVAQQRQRFNKAYDDIWSRNDVTIRPQTAASMQKIVADAYRDLGSEGGKVVENQFNRILDDVARAGQGGTISGRNYQALSSALAGVQPGSPVGNYVGRLRGALVADADASVNKADTSLLRQVNQQYNNFKTLEKLLSQQAGASADVGPARLWAAVNARGPKATKEFRDLARVGQNLLKDPIPQNGLVGSTLGGLLTGGAGYAAGTGGVAPMLGALAAGATVGRGLNSAALGGYLARNAGKPSPLAEWLAAGGVVGKVRRGAAGAAQRTGAPNAPHSEGLDIEIGGGTPAARAKAAERYEEMLRRGEIR